MSALHLFAHCAVNSALFAINRTRTDTNAFIEHHRNVAAERGLNFHRDLRRNERSRAVDVILKLNAVLGDLRNFTSEKI